MTTATLTTTRWFGLYARDSSDPDDLSVRVTNQRELGERAAADIAPGVELRVYTDNDLSASKADVHRPELARLLDDLERGGCVGLWVSETSRLSRRESESFAIYDALAEAGVGVIHTAEGVVEIGSELAGIKTVLASAEARRISRRVKQAHDLMAEQGRPTGQIGFGYRAAVGDDGRATREIEPTEAAIIREAAGRFLDGASLGSIARDLTDRGIRSKRGKRPSVNTIRGWLTNDGVRGRRRANGVLVKATWPAILTDEVWQAIRARLDAGRTPRIDGRHSRRREYLLAGTVRCSCGGAMSGRSKRQSGGRPHRLEYWCHAGCGATIGAETADAVVSEAFLDRLSVLNDRLAGDDEHEEERAAILAELERLEDHKAAKVAAFGKMLADDDLDVAVYRRAKAAIADRERALRAKLAELPTPTTDAIVDVDFVRASWSALDTPEQRDLLHRFTAERGDPIVVERPRQGLKGADRVRLPEGWS